MKAIKSRIDRQNTDPPAAFSFYCRYRALYAGPGSSL